MDIGHWVFKIGLYSEYQCCLFNIGQLDFHIGLCSECSPCTSISDIGHSHRFVLWISTLHNNNYVQYQCRHSQYKPVWMSNVQYRKSNIHIRYMSMSNMKLTSLLCLYITQACCIFKHLGKKNWLVLGFTFVVKNTLWRVPVFDNTWLSTAYFRIRTENLEKLNLKSLGALYWIFSFLLTHLFY